MNIIFCLDRDFDHIYGRIIDSQHILYTEHADIEAEIFTHGDEISALLTAASLDLDTTVRLKEHLGQWRTDLADLLREWIELCIIADVLSITNLGIGFGRRSSINGPDCYSPSVSSEVTAVLSKIRNAASKAGLPDRESNARLAAIIANIDAI
jgi:hypothetical protein